MYIAHLDMDAFFASVSLLKYPFLTNFPVVIGGVNKAIYTPKYVAKNNSYDCALLNSYNGRSVISTANYIARKLGLHSGMSLVKAAEIANRQRSEVILLPTDFELYKEFSKKFKNIVKNVLPENTDIENVGIDEIYFDLRNLSIESIILYCQKIQHTIKKELNLTCSIGLATSKLMAKMASDMQKPFGLTKLDFPRDLYEKIWTLPVKKLNGIGKKSAEKLHKLNIFTIGELAATPLDLLQNNFGKSYSNWLYLASRGEYFSPLITQSEHKSLSRELTFPRDLDLNLYADKTIIYNYLEQLAIQLSDDLKKHNFGAKTISTKIRYSNFQRATKDKTISFSDSYVYNHLEILNLARYCLDKLPKKLPIRLLGIRASHLVSVSAENNNKEKNKQQQQLLLQLGIKRE